jgi:hypothetical protein
MMQKHEEGKNTCSDRTTPSKFLQKGNKENRGGIPGSVRESERDEA